MEPILRTYSDHMKGHLTATKQDCRIKTFVKRGKDGHLIRGTPESKENETDYSDWADEVIRNEF